MSGITDCFVSVYKFDEKSYPEKVPRARGDIIRGRWTPLESKSMRVREPAATPMATIDPLLPFASGSYAVFDPRVLDSIDNLPTTVTTFSGAFQRDIAVA